MSEKSENLIPRKDFFAWLLEGTEPLQFVGNTKSCTTFVKLPHGENTVYLFSATQYSGTDIRWNTTFEFCGMYFPETQTLRLVEFDLARAVHTLEADEMRNSELWCYQIRKQVNERIEQKLGNDRSRLSSQELSNAKNIQWLQDFKEYGAKRQATEIFLKGDAPDLEYHSAYDLQQQTEEYKENALLAFFQNGDRFLDAEAQKYLETREEDILLEFLKNDALRKEYETLQQDIGSDVFLHRKITLALREAGAETVSITIEKYGIEQTFRADVREIRRGNGSYSPYCIVSGADRRKYEDLFGKYTEFSAQDITRITYKRAVQSAWQPNGVVRLCQQRQERSQPIAADDRAAFADGR